MPISTLDSLLKRIPSFYNKYLGTNPVNTDIKIPAPPNTPVLTIGNAPVVQNSSNIVKLASSSAFSLDLMFANIQTTKDISYVGQVPVQFSNIEPPSQLINLAISAPNPVAVVADGFGNYYVASGNGFGVQLDSTGTVVATYGSPGINPDQLTAPSDIAVAADGRVFITDIIDPTDSKINVYQNDGTFIQTVVTATPYTYLSVAYNPITTNIYALTNDFRVETYETVTYTRLQDLWTNFPTPTLTSPKQVRCDASGYVFVSDVGAVFVFQVPVNPVINNGTLLGQFNSQSFMPGTTDYIGLSFLGSTNVLAYNSVRQVVEVFSYDPLFPITSSSFTYVTSFFRQGIGTSDFLAGGFGVCVNNSNQLVFMDTGNSRLVILEFVFSLSLFSGFLENTALPGNIFNITQTIPATYSFTIPPLQNPNVVTYVIVQNDSTSVFSFTCEEVIIPPGGYQVYNWRPEIGFWEPVTITAYVTDNFLTQNPPNAVFVPGPVFPGHSSPDLDNIGDNFGVTRLVTENDVTYRKRITESVVGPKLTPQGMVEQFRIIYGLDIQVFQWFPSSFSNLATYLTANPGYTAYYEDRSLVVPTDTTDGYFNLDPTKTQGPPDTFYITVPQSQFRNFNNGVYPNSLIATPPDWTFVDYEDTIIGPGRHGGFFKSNSGEPNYILSSLIERYLILISSIKAAGTYGILIIIPA